MCENIDLERTDVQSTDDEQTALPAELQDAFDHTVDAKTLADDGYGMARRLLSLPGKERFTPAESQAIKGLFGQAKAALDRARDAVEALTIRKKRGG